MRVLENKRGRRTGGFAAALCWAGLYALSLRAAPAPVADAVGTPPRVVCSTTMLQAVVQAVGGPELAVHALIPFGMCPGHFDVTPGEAARLRSADLWLAHGFERMLHQAGPLEARPNLQRVPVSGNWMVPAVHVQGVEAVRAILATRWPARAEGFGERATAYAEQVRHDGERAKDRLAAHQGRPVVCAAISRDLVEWYGFEVVATFPRDENVSVQSLQRVLAAARAAGAVLVLDNRQSSGRVGRTLARELEVPLVMLTNFPEPDEIPPGETTYLRALHGQIEAIRTALTTGS